MLLQVNVAWNSAGGKILAVVIQGCRLIPGFDAEVDSDHKSKVTGVKGINKNRDFVDVITSVLS